MINKNDKYSFGQNIISRNCTGLLSTIWSIKEENKKKNIFMINHDWLMFQEAWRCRVTPGVVRVRMFGWGPGWGGGWGRRCSCTPAWWSEVRPSEPWWGRSPARTGTGVSDPWWSWTLTLPVTWRWGSAQPSQPPAAGQPVCSSQWYQWFITIWVNSTKVIPASSAVVEWRTYSSQSGFSTFSLKEMINSSQQLLPVTIIRHTLLENRNMHKQKNIYKTRF